MTSNRQDKNLAISGHEANLDHVPKTSKVCAKCTVDLPLDKFSRKRDGYDSRCKECISRSKATKYKQKRANEAKVREAIIRIEESFEIFETCSGKPLDMNQIVTTLKNAMENGNEEV